MNHCYRVLWSEASGGFVAVAETARAGCRGASLRRRARRLALAGLLAGALAAQAAPQGGRVSAGEGRIRTEGAVTTIDQASARLAIRWDSFGVGAGETVRFVQPGRHAVALNRVLGTDPSRILGRLEANGQVFLLNPNGVLFGRTAQVSVGGLLASTLDLAEADFLAGRHVLRGAGGRVRNDGSIRAADGGYVALVGAVVHNEGHVVAQRGGVALAAGSRVTLDFAGDGLLRLSVDAGALGALVRNGGVVQADGGSALLTARAADALVGTVINNTGVVRARTLERHGGVVRLLGSFDGGTVEAGGTLDVSAPQGGDAGFVDTSGARVRILPGARVALAAAAGRAGRWLIDPTDITIDAGAAGAIVSALDAGGTVTTSTAGPGGDAGDIYVVSPVAWSGTGTWSLEADRDIAIHAEIRGTQGGLALAAGNAIRATAPVHVGDFGLWSGDWRQVTATLPAFSAANFHVEGGSFLRATGGNGSSATPYRIVDLYGLQGVGSNAATLSQHYVLMNDIDASATVNWNGGAGWRPIGSMWDMFTGSFDGDDRVVSNLHVNLGGTDGVGLFGALAATGAVRNVGVRGGSFQGFAAVGGVAGYNEGSMERVWSDAAVAGGFSVGGVVGWNLGGVVHSHAGGAVTGFSHTGGFVGQNDGIISASWATGTVAGEGGTGGFAGANSSTGTIVQAYATGAVTATGWSTGGFVGWNQGAIADAYATGAVSARLPVYDGIGAQNTGGFFGSQDVGGTIARVYSTGFVDNDSVIVGGLGGSNFGGTVTSSYWDVQASGRTRGIGRNNGGTGLTTAQARSEASFAGFGFGSTWAIYEGRTNPLLAAFLTPLIVTANDAARHADGTPWAGGNGVSYSMPPGPGLLGTVTYGGSAQGATVPGTYEITAGGLYSSQQGYLIEYASGTLTLTAAPPPGPAPAPAPPPAGTPSPAPGSDAPAAAPYPHAEPVERPACAPMTEDADRHAGGCAQPLRLRVVDGGMRMPPVPRP